MQGKYISVQREPALPPTSAGGARARTVPQRLVAKTYFWELSSGQWGALPPFAPDLLAALTAGSYLRLPGPAPHPPHGDRLAAAARAPAGNSRWAPPRCWAGTVSKRSFVRGGPLLCPRASVPRPVPERTALGVRLPAQPGRRGVSPRAEFRARPPPPGAPAPRRPRAECARPAATRRRVRAVAVATRRQTGRRASLCGRARFACRCLPGPSRRDPTPPGSEVWGGPSRPRSAPPPTSPILGPDPFRKLKATDCR